MTGKNTPGGELKVVLLDLMDTLVEDPYHRLFAPDNPIVNLRTFLKWKERSSFEEFERGEISEAEFFARYYQADTPAEIARELPSPRKLKKRILKFVRFLPGLEEIWEEVLARSNTRVGIASNYSAWYHRILELKPVLRRADYLFFSCEMGVRKPDPQYFRIIEDALLTEHPGLTPDRIFFADDRGPNVDAAAERGWATARMPALTEPEADTIGALRPALTKFLSR